MIESGALHLKYRPRDFDEIVGNKATVDSLISVLDRDRIDIPHTMLFVGPSGTGKTTLARIVANKLGCSERDFREINVSEKRGIDTSREIITTMHYKPMMGNVRVYLMDECHRGTLDFWSSLLKPLEDTPGHVYFLLCTTEPNKLLPTIRNRCSTFSVAKLDASVIIGLLKSVLKQERVDVEGKILRKMAKLSEGSPRQALVLLDKIIDLEPEDMEEAVEREQIEERQVIELCRALLEKSSWKKTAAILKGIDVDEEKVRYAILGYFNKVLLDTKDNQKQVQAVLIIEYFSEPFYSSGKAGLAYACFNCCS